MTVADLHEPMRLDLPYPTPVTTTRGSRYDYPFGGDDGYDWMGTANPKLGYREIANWGQDGWDLGSWPYVIISLSSDGTTVLEYCEGDLVFETFATREDAEAKIDSAFLFHADEHVARALTGEVAETPTKLADVPDRFKGPFSWARVKLEREDA